MSMNLTVRRCGDHLGGSVALVLAAVGCALVLVPSGCSRSSGTSAGSSTYTLMQMNLCLSGLAGCYGKVAYPAEIGRAHV